MASERLQELAERAKTSVAPHPSPIIRRARALLTEYDGTPRDILNEHMDDFLYDAACDTVGFRPADMWQETDEFWAAYNGALNELLKMVGEK